MEGRLGRLLARISSREPSKPKTVTSAQLERRIPGITDRLTTIRERAMEPHIAYELQGITFIPIRHPGFRAIDAAIAAGEPVPPFEYIPDSLVVTSDGLNIADDPAFETELRGAIADVNAGKAAPRLDAGREDPQE